MKGLRLQEDMLLTDFIHRIVFCYLLLFLKPFLFIIVSTTALPYVKIILSCPGFTAKYGASRAG